MINTDGLTLYVNSNGYYGWQELRVTRSAERLPSDFSVIAMDDPATAAQMISEGDPCEIKLGDDLVLTGYVDAWNPSFSKSHHGVCITGRSKCQDLVDCSAIWTNNVITNVNTLQLAQRLAKPYGINVTTDVTDLTSVPQFTLNWGESSQEVIDRAGRWAGLLYYDLPNGDLFLSRVGTKKAASGVSEGVNIQKADFAARMDDRFSDYTGVSMSISGVNEISGNAGYTSVTLATRQDPGAAKLRYRNRVILVESTLISKGMSQQAIDWEMNRRYGRSKYLRVVVDSWRDSSGQLWEPNTLIPINIPRFNLIDRLWLLTEVSYIKNSRDGTTAELVLMPPEAMSIQPYQFYSGMMELR